MRHVFLLFDRRFVTFKKGNLADIIYSIKMLNTGKWTEKELDGLLEEATGIADNGERIAFLSGRFLGTEYRESTLRGSADIAEELVVNLAALDCFTFVDYVEAMRSSRSLAEFIERLKRVRYRKGDVAFRQRNHFLADWRQSNSEFVEDVTGRLGEGRAVRVQKVLNEKEGGGSWVPGIAAVGRAIEYIPSPLSEDVLSRLRTGDYAGVYSNAAGLDVSHAGIVVRDCGLFFRHASSRLMKVVDEELQAYFSDTPGMIVLRPK